MHSEFTYIEDSQVLLIHTTGVVETASWPSIIGRSMEEGRKYSCTRFLFDQRDGDFRLNLEHLFGMPRNAGRFTLPMRVRIALLLPQLPPAEQKFIETFNNDRGFNLKVFHDKDLAIAWLVENAPPPDLIIES